MIGFNKLPSSRHAKIGSLLTASITPIGVIPSYITLNSELRRHLDAFINNTIF